ncbi:MAG TPA: MBL fold metallo-hydrolase [Chitinophagaceae bacterium]|nr:MBL fold metallo-hydrolase [Chitinophagaceae bacterium]
MKKITSILILTVSVLVAGCGLLKKDNASPKDKNLPELFLVVLGIAQDAGYPQAGCEKACCAAYYTGKEEKKLVNCLALVDKKNQQYWLIEATPDMALQLKNLQDYLPAADYSPDGIFISHAHIGHYTGLMQLGREAMGAKDIPVWVMPRMDSFIRNNGPWSQLVRLNNIRLQSLRDDSTVVLNSSLTIKPFKVPHRDEYSETVGFVIQSDKKKLLFIPDIDKWEKWERDIAAQIRQMDVALLDGTFYKNGELPGRDMKEVPHPFVEESLQKFSALSSADKSKVVFIHLNHTNPLLKKKSAEKEKLRKEGFAVAEEGMIIAL